MTNMKSVVFSSVFIASAAALLGAPAEQIADVAQPIETMDTTEDLRALRADFRRDLEIYYPDDNLPNAARIELGHVLFFDPRLSRSGGQSCASCHNPALAWGDGQALGLGDHLEELKRRSPSILNLAWSEPLMWDGRAETLEEQALGPFLADDEMNMPLDQLVHVLESVAGYRDMFAAAFEGDPDITPERVATALAAYQRTIISEPAPFDAWVEGDETAISEAAKRGFELFVGQANCATCHEGWRFTDDGFYDIGLKGSDLGRGALFPNIPTMQFAFKTPGLRNVALTAPYMHDGSLASLQAVIEFYDRGGDGREGSELEPLGLTAEEKRDLIAFLGALTQHLDIEKPQIPADPAGFGEE